MNYFLKAEAALVLKVKTLFPQGDFSGRWTVVPAAVLTVEERIMPRRESRFLCVHILPAVISTQRERKVTLLLIIITTLFLCFTVFLQWSFFIKIKEKLRNILKILFIFYKTEI